MIGIYEAVSHFESQGLRQSTANETFVSYVIEELMACGQDINEVCTGLQVCFQLFVITCVCEKLNSFTK